MSLVLISKSLATGGVLEPMLELGCLQFEELSFKVADRGWHVGESGHQDWFPHFGGEGGGNRNSRKILGLVQGPIHFDDFISL